MDDRKKTAERIRALLAKTTDRGCTESEALAAASKAADLLNRYQLSLSDVELEAEGFVRGLAEKPERRRFDVQAELARDVAKFCDCKTWLQADYDNGRIRWRLTFFGLRSDVEFANWLVKALERFVWQAADDYAARTDDGSYYSKRSFAKACCKRIGERLQSEIEKRDCEAKTVGGRSLVVVKNGMLERQYEKLGLRLGTITRRYMHGHSDSAAEAGRAAGERAGFGRPVNGGNNPKAIGGHA